MKESLMATYFPFSAMATSVAGILSCCLNRVTLYRAVGSAPSASLQSWVDEGFLDIRIPFAEIIDKDLVTAGFTDWKTWGSMHESADLAYLKQMGHKLAPVEPSTPRLASEIKGATGKGKDKTHERDLTVQLFLLLAEDFDQQSLDIQEQWSAIERQKQALEDSFHIDSLEQQGSLASGDRSSRRREDLGSFMTETRLIAWNHLFQKAPAPSNVLVTDSPAAIDFLLEDQEEKVKVLHYPMPYGPHASIEFPWKDHLAPLFGDLITKPWNDDLRRQVKQVNVQIRSAAPSEDSSTRNPSQPIAVFSWYLVPHVTAADLLDRRCKKKQALEKKRGESNTLVGLVNMDDKGYPG